MADNIEKTIWMMYKHIEERDRTGMKTVKYCDMHGLCVNQFNNIRHRMKGRKHTDPEWHELHKIFYEEFMKTNLSVSEFCTKHQIKKSHLEEFILHVRYTDIIEKYKQKEQKLQFIQVAKPTEVNATPTPETEVVVKKNDIEIQINQGVKVIISPDVDPLKIIKIIELLKEL